MGLAPGGGEQADGGRGVSAGLDEPAGPSAQRVFISYRRQDSAAYAGRVYDAMVARFGERHVFMDLELAPGVDFVERITEAVSACQVLIEVMGPTWATVKNEEGQVRIADPEDFVRLELEIALKRPEVTVIPVLVSGAEMPDRRDLPPELGAISRRNALELSDRRWRYDVGQLIDALEELLAGTTAVHATPTSADVAAKTEASPEGAPTGPARIPAGTADPGRAGNWLRGRGRLFAGVAALAVLAVVLAIVTLGGGSGAETSRTSSSCHLRAPQRSRVSTCRRAGAQAARATSIRSPRRAASKPFSWLRTTRGRLRSSGKPTPTPTRRRRCVRKMPCHCAKAKAPRTSRTLSSSP